MFFMTDFENELALFSWWLNSWTEEQKSEIQVGEDILNYLDYS